MALGQLTPQERTAWCSSLRLDSPEKGRTEFFAVIWPRMGQMLSSLPVNTELLVDNMKAFGAEHMSYMETQFMVDGMLDNEGNVIDPDGWRLPSSRSAFSLQPDALRHRSHRALPGYHPSFCAQR